MPFIDSHAHLDGADSTADREAVKTRAFEAELSPIPCFGALHGSKGPRSTLDLRPGLEIAHESAYVPRFVDWAPPSELCRVVGAL